MIEDDDNIEITEVKCMLCQLLKIKICSKLWKKNK